MRQQTDASAEKHSGNLTGDGWFDTFPGKRSLLSCWGDRRKGISVLLNRKAEDAAHIGWPERAIDVKSDG
jgi:hypothetical protein